MTATTQDTRHTATSCSVSALWFFPRSVAAAAARSLVRFSPNPSCRGDVANPWLESAFITHFGCVSRHLFVCFPQCIVIACVSRRVSSLLVFLLGFSRVSSLLVFRYYFASGTARARSFCTHQRPRITKSADLKHIHHKDRRQLQLSRRRWLHDCTASYVRSFKTHISSRSLFPRHWPVSALPPAKRRARLNTCRSRPVRARCTRCRCCNVCSCVTFPSQVHRRQTPPTSSSCSGRASLALSRLFKTRSVQDTFHDACFCPTHHVNYSRSGDRVRGASFFRHLHRALSSDRVRGACTCRHPCSAFSSNRIRGTYTFCHIRSDFFCDRVRGFRTCCLPCRTSDTD